MRKIIKSTVAVGTGLALLAAVLPLLSNDAAATTATPPIPKSVILTNSSNGSTVVASTGELVIVNLTGGPLRWTEAHVVPVASAKAPVLDFLSGSTSANGSSTATFLVAGAGTAQLRAAGSPICSTTAVCPPYVVLWRASIVVPAVAAVATPPIPKSVILTNSSNGSTVVASIGESVIVNLTGGPLRWTEAQLAPVATAKAPVLVFVSGSTSANGSSTATFRVVSYGTAQLRAIGSPICPTAMACPTYVVLWHASVVVPVVDPPVV
jgi:hypothetical protein